MQLLVIVGLLILALCAPALAGTISPYLFWNPGSIAGWVDVSAGLTGTTNAKLGDATGTCTYTENTDPAFLKNKRGKNIKLVMTGGTTSTTFCRLIWQPTAKDFARIGTLGVRWHSSTSNVAVVSAVTVDITNDTGGSNGFRFILSDLRPSMREGWQYVQFQRDESSLLGTGTWVSGTMARTHVQFAVEANQSATVYIDEYTYAPYQMPAIVPILVGAYSEHYTIGFGKFLNLGIKGTLVVPTSQIGAGGRMSASQITEMYLAGWSIIHCGTSQFDDWTALSQAQVEQKIVDAETVFRANGWTRDMKHVWLPGTVWSAYRSNATVDLALQAKGVLTAIGPWDLTISSGQHLNGMAVDPVYGITDAKYRLHAYQIHNPETQADVLALAKNKVGQGNYLAVEMGRITASPTVVEIATADFNAIFEAWARTPAIHILPLGRFFDSLEAKRLTP